MPAMSGRTRSALCWTIFVGTLVATVGASAHEVGLSRGTYVIDGETVTATLQLAPSEADSVFAKADTLIGLSVAGEACSAGTAVREARDDDTRIVVRFTCPAAPETLSLDVTGLLATLGRGHRHHVAVRHGDWAFDEIAFGDTARFELEPGAAGVESSTFGGYVVIGVEHIVFGFDHVVFVLALFMVAGSLRAYIFMITAFTVSHSVTLGLAVLGYVDLGGHIVEPIIALSIAWVGVENFLVKNVDRRWMITFVFGLIHGLGFAGALGEIGLPPDRLLSSLLAFNLGVEAGQLAILAVALPLLTLGRKNDAFVKYFIPAANVAIVVIGTWWLLERTVLA